MTNQEILDKIATLEKGISNPSVPESAKATLKTKIEALKAQIEKVEEKLEQKEEKLEQKEEKVQNELEEKISKLERGINNPNVPESAKAALRKKLADAKQELSSQKKEIAEDKKEAKQEMKEVKEAVKDLEKAAKSQRKNPIKKPVIKEKERAVKSEKRTAKLKSLLTGLDAIVEKNKALKEKYKGKGVDLKKDAGRPAKPFGYRFVGKHDYRKPSEAQIKSGLKRGTIDYEARPNRSDKYPKGYKGSIKLADGGMAGMMAKGGKPKDLPVVRTQFEEEEFEYARGGKTKKAEPKHSRAKDAQRFAKPKGYRWKNEAVTDGIIKKAALSKVPSLYQRKKYPDYVYYEDRTSKSDKSPSKKHQSL